MCQVLESPEAVSEGYLITAVAPPIGEDTAFLIPGWLLYHYDKEVIGILSAVISDCMEVKIPETVIMDEDWIFVRKIQGKMTNYEGKLRFVLGLNEITYFLREFGIDDFAREGLKVLADKGAFVVLGEDGQHFEALNV